MTAPAVFWLSIGLLGGAAALGMVLDASGVRRRSELVVGALVTAAGCVSLAASWSFSPQRVTGSFVTGGGFSVTAGVIAFLAGLLILAEDDLMLIHPGQRATLMSLSTLGLVLAVQSANVVSVVICLEIAGVCGYALISGARTARSAQAAMTYFVQGALGTGLLVVGAGVLVALYIPLGTYAQLSEVAASGGDPLVLGMLAVLAGLAVKTAAAPLHWWAPDAYETAPSSAAGFLAGPAKLAAVVSMAVLVGVSAGAGSSDTNPLGVLGADLFPIIGALALASLVIGSVLGLRQRSYARMLAYSGVAQVGFALVALASGSAPVAVLYGCVYAVATGGAFSAAEAIRRNRGHWDGSIAALSGIGRTDPVLGVSVSVLLLSLAGIPPLVGFWSKLLVLRSAVILGTGLYERGHTDTAAWYAVLVVTAIGAAVVSLAYYGAVIRATFEPGGESDAVRGGVARSVTVFLALVVVILGLLPAVVPFDKLVSIFLF